MSLLQEIENERLGLFGKKKNPTEDTEEESRIIQVSQFMKIARQVLDLRLLDKKTINKMKSHRFRLKSTNWHLESLIGHATETIFSNMCGMVVEGWLKTINHSQSNGDWQLAEYEITLGKDGDGLDIMLVGARFIDVLDKQDLTYNNGVPSSFNVNVTTPTIPDELITALGSRSTGDDELKELLKQLIGTMAAGATKNDEPTEAVTGEDGLEVT